MGENSIVALVDVVRAVAQRGLTYAADRYDRERYETLAAAAAEAYGELADLPPQQIQARFARDVGYPTAKVGADAAIFRERSLLLIRRADTGQWALPGGWVDPGETPESTAERETHEETGLQVAARRIIGVHTEVASTKTAPHSAVHVLVYCTASDDSHPTPTAEAIEVGYRDPSVISNWHGDHGAWARAALEWWDGAQARGRIG